MLRIPVCSRLLPLTPATVAWSLPVMGLLPAFAHPPLEWSASAWIALAPPLWMLARGAGGVALWLGAGWGYGLAHAAFQYGWLPEALWVKGGLTLPVFLAFTLAGWSGMALYPAAAFALSRWLWLRWSLSPYATFPALYALQDALLGVTPFGGAPWGSLAATQGGTWAAAAIVPLFGGSGLALALGAVNAGWAVAVGLGKGLRLARLPVHAPLLAMAALTLVCLWPARPDGSWDGPPEGTGGPQPFRALMVGGDLSLDWLAQPSQGQAGLRHFAARTLEALTAPATSTPSQNAGQRPVLVVWPESAVPGEVARGKLLADLFELARALDTDFLFGSNARDLGRIHNSAYLVTGERFATVRYDKRRLVPFGEYVPEGFRGLFGKKLTAGAQDYAPGSRPPVLDWRGIRLGVAICFESILPAHAREAARAGAQALVVLSNDGWLSPAAGRQHLRLTALRGLETGLDTLMVANGGPSALIRRGWIVLEASPGGAPVPVTMQAGSGGTVWAHFGYVPLLSLLAGWLGLTVAWRDWGRRW